MSFARRQNRKFRVEEIEVNPKTRTCARLADNRRFSITPQQLDVLELLLQNAGEIVTYEEFEKEIWEGVSVGTRPILRHAINHLRSIFGREKIQTVTDTGYRFILTAPILIEFIDGSFHETQPVEADFHSESPKWAPPEFPEQPTKTEPEMPPNTGELPDVNSLSFELFRLFGGHAYFVVVACLLYSSVCVVSLYLETAYEFQQYKTSLFQLSFPVFILAMFFSLLSFQLIYFLHAKKHSAKGLGLGIFTILAGSLILVLVGNLILPAHSITKIASSQTHTQTAQSSHFKNVFIYLQLFYIPAVVIPYGLIISWKSKISTGLSEEVRKVLQGKPSGIRLPSRLNLSPLLMIFILLTVFIFSVATTHLFLDKLEPGDNQNLFSNLMWGRNILYYCIGILGIWWYHEKRKELEAFCFMEASRKPQT